MEKKYKIEIINNENPDLSWIGYFASPEEAISWREKQKGKPNRKENEASFSDVIDLSLDSKYVLKKLQNDRKKLYPSTEEIIEALMEDKEGRPAKLQKIIQMRAKVKQDIPIPDDIKEN